MRKLIIIAAALFAFCSNAQELKEVTVLHWNDFHARNQPYKVSVKDSSGEQVYYHAGGTGSMLGYLNKYRTPNSLVLNGGDDFQGTPVSNFTRGRSQIELLNLFNLDAFVLGNHEFDYSRYSLDSALEMANFPVLSANVFIQSTNSLMARPYVIKEVNSVKIGIIGVTLPDLFLSSLPKNVEGLTMLNTDSVIQAGITALKGEGCDIIVLLTHAGVDADKRFAEKFYPDVDIIVGGHTHTPLFKPARQNGVIIVQAGSNGRYLGKLDLKIDTEKDTVISSYGSLIETVLDSSIFDKTAGSIADSLTGKYASELNIKIGILESDWRAGYSNESNLGQFQADAIKIKTGADIAFVNGGGLRKSLFKGDILVGDIWEINPFGNEIQTFTVLGKTLRQMIKNNIKIRRDKIKSGEGAEILNTSGLNYSYNSKIAESGGEDFLLSLNHGRSEVQDDMSYTIATNSFVISQFKKFFGEIDEKIEPKETGWMDRDLIIEAVKEAGTINSVLEKRIVDVAKNK